jgi:hypothetical protein
MDCQKNTLYTADCFKQIHDPVYVISKTNFNTENLNEIIIVVTWDQPCTQRNCQTKRLQSSPSAESALRSNRLL